MLAVSSRERRRLPKKQGFHARVHWAGVWACEIRREKRDRMDRFNHKKYFKGRMYYYKVIVFPKKTEVSGKAAGMFNNT